MGIQFNQSGERRDLLQPFRRREIMKKMDLKMWKVILLRELKDLACRVYNNIINNNTVDSA